MKLKLADLRNKRGDLIDSLPGLIDDQAEFDRVKSEITDLDGQIARAAEAENLARTLARPADGDDRPNPEAGAADDVQIVVRDGAESRRGWGDGQYLAHARRQLQPTGFAFDAQRHFRSFGEQLRAVARYYVNRGDAGAQDPRLVRAPTSATVGRAATGNLEADPSLGGFLVQTDFAAAVMQRANDIGMILPRVNRLPISANANGIKIPGVDESSRATGSRWGGVQSYWVGEGTSVTASKPKFRLIELDLKKLMSTWYVTDELLADSALLGRIGMQAFSEEFMFMIEDAIFEGTGAGQPQGILNAPCVVSVAKETGQAAATIVKENIDKMWSRCWARSRSNAAWFINQDCEPQLYGMNQVVGTGGVPVYLPAGGLSAAPFASLYGRPVIPTEYNATLGTVGDIVLADFSQYALADKGGLQTAQSMHVAFLTDEMVFRFTWRVDGEPTWHSALTPFKGSATKSPFVTLATRA